MNTKQDGLRTALDLTLTTAETRYIAAFITDDAEQDDEAVRLLIGDGHSGYGLYAAHPEYPEEGAIFVKSISASTKEAASDTELSAETRREAIASALMRFAGFDRVGLGGRRP